MIKPPARTAYKKASLYRFLAVVALMCIALPALVSGGALIYANFKRTIEVDSRIAANGYADVLEAGMSIPLWNLSPDLGQPIVENVFVDPSVLGVFVESDNGEKFLEYVRNTEVFNTDALEVTREIHYDGEKIGRLTLVYSSEKAVLQATKEAKLLAAIITLQLIFSLAVISFLLNRRVLSPLKKLDQAAAGIAQGDLRTTIPELNDDEFGQLSRRLEKMRGVLEENFTELENRVDVRTAELQTVNQTLQGTLNQLRTTQDHLVQSEKLAALGALVAGVAHELNTPIGNGLTVVSSLCDACEAMQENMKKGVTKAQLERFIADMDEGTSLVCRNLERASELVSGFKQVAVDRTSAQRREFSLRAFLDETLLTVSPIFKRTPYKVQLEMDGEIKMNSYPGPLGQVITNLLNNAVIHAFDGREQGQVTVYVVRRGQDVEIKVCDNGVGISEENLARIFDPFFTTKLGAGGNGLGMHIVHNIVNGVLGGHITATSVVGEGTVFSLVLPTEAPLKAEEISMDMDETNLANA